MDGCPAALPELRGLGPGRGSLCDHRKLPPALRALVVGGPLVGKPTWLCPDLSQGQAGSWAEAHTSPDTSPPPTGAAHRAPGLQRHPGERGPRGRGPEGGAAALPPEPAVTRPPGQALLGALGAQMGSASPRGLSSWWDFLETALGAQDPQSSPMTCSPQAPGLPGIFNKEQVAGRRSSVCVWLGCGRARQQGSSAPTTRGLWELPPLRCSPGPADGACRAPDPASRGTHSPRPGCGPSPVDGAGEDLSLATPWGRSLFPSSAGPPLTPIPQLCPSPGFPPVPSLLGTAPG